MPYNRFLRLPEVKKVNNDTLEITHNHAYEFIFGLESEKPTMTERSEARKFFEQKKLKVALCIAFLKDALEGGGWNALQIAAIQHEIRLDELLIESLDDTKPSACALM